VVWPEPGKLQHPQLRCNGPPFEFRPREAQMQHKTKTLSAAIVP